MFDMQWPWLMLLIPLPFLMRFVPAKKQQESALRVPFYQYAKELTQHQTLNKNKKPLRFGLLFLIWILTLLAATNPQWVGEPTNMPSQGRDLLMAVDISGSMEETDMVYAGQRITRLMAVKKVMSDFVTRRTSDRLGLILFGAQAYLQAPLTYDRNTVNQLLIEAQIGFAGRETAIGDAIGLAVKRLRDKPNASRVLVLLTDGANTAGQLSPDKATELAQKAKIKIYTIAFGAESMEVPGIFGTRRINPSQDLDETTMRAVAEKTGGEYFRARSLEELDEIHHRLDRLEPIEMDTQVFRPIQTLFYWPLLLALLLSVGLAMQHLWSNRPTPQTVKQDAKQSARSNKPIANNLKATR